MPEGSATPPANGVATAAGGVALGTAAPGVAMAPAGTPSAALGPTEAVPPAGEVAIAPTAPPQPGATCLVSLGSRPWADVWLDGRRVGFTPLSDLAVTCGPHDIVFTSTRLGVERRISITARPGEKVKRIVDLEALPLLAAPGLGADAAGGAAGTGAGCRLSLGSRPWSEVWVDGKRAGITPLMSLPVACGKHDLLFLSREANVEHRETVVLRNGQTLKRVVTLVEGD
jgi:hypothetical protein